MPNRVAEKGGERAHVSENLTKNFRVLMIASFSVFFCTLIQLNNNLQSYGLCSWYRWREIGHPDQTNKTKDVVHTVENTREVGAYFAKKNYFWAPQE